VVSTARATLELHVTHQLLLCEDKVQHSTLSHGFLYYLEEGLAINTFQKPLRFLVHCCVVPPTDIVVVKVPHKDYIL